MNHPFSVLLDRLVLEKRVLGNQSILFVLVLALFLAGCGAASGPAQGPTPTSTPHGELTGTISEFPLTVPHFLPGDITAGSDGNLWFTALAEKTPAGIVERITPQGSVKVFQLPNGSFSNSITSGPDGNLWIKEPGKIGRITTTGTISEFSLSSSTRIDTENWPATLYGSTLWGDITTGPDHALWFTEPPASLNENGKIGRITTTGTITEYSTSKIYPFGITTGSDGNLWFTAIDYSKFGGVIGRITPTGSIRLFPLPKGFFSLYIVSGPDGNLWFTEADLDGWNDKIGRITLTGTISEFPVPDRLSNVNGITAGPDNAIWFTEDTSNHGEKGRIGRITLNGSMKEFPLPTSSGGPGGITVGPDSNLWFTEMLGNKIGCLS